MFPAVKTCTKCKQEKPLDDFFLYSRGKGDKRKYPRAVCKVCHRIVLAKYKEKNSKRIALQSRKDILKKYGLSPVDYNDMFIEQKGCCALCGKHQLKTEGALAVDHNHKTKKVRGLLCKKCNIGLGYYEWVKNNTTRFENFENYLGEN